MADQPIVVRCTPTVEQIQAGLRQAVSALGLIAGTLGYAGLFPDSRVNMLMAMTGPVAWAISTAFGQYATWRSGREKATMAQATPDAVAVIKG